MALLLRFLRDQFDFSQVAGDFTDVTGALHQY
jgi:hypothetical protein